jgi:hypothetical protein
MPSYENAKQSRENRDTVACARGERAIGGDKSPECWSFASNVRPERIAAFAVWFAEQKFGWKDTRKEPPTDMMLVLLKDAKLNVCRLGYRTNGGLVHQ